MCIVNVLSGSKLVWLAPPSTNDVARDAMMQSINQGVFHVRTETIKAADKKTFSELGIRWLTVDEGIVTIHTHTHTSVTHTHTHTRVHVAYICVCSIIHAHRRDNIHPLWLVSCRQESQAHCLLRGWSHVSSRFN